MSETTTCTNCDATRTGCETRRWLSGRTCCDTCTHERPPADRDLDKALRRLRHRGEGGGVATGSGAP